jgi:hypothetical protein
METSIVWIGRDLLAVKQMLEHGQFVHWVAKECGFSIRTAQNYMRVAEFFEGKSAIEGAPYGVQRQEAA